MIVFRTVFLKKRVSQIDKTENYDKLFIRKDNVRCILDAMLH